MTTFPPHLRRAAAEAVGRLPHALRPEIYVVSFRIGRHEDDPRRPYLTVGCNTESRYHERLRHHGADEARWNPAHWLPGGERVGGAPEDPAGAAAFRAEAIRLGFWYEDGDDLTDDEEDDCAEALYGLFADACERAAEALSAHGMVAAALGRAAPVVVHDPSLGTWDPPRRPDPHPLTPHHP
ncbi:hypothetical protein JNUCC64_25790 [Streptomyces sp. JNUCC 64]